jgi:hypothetical protein
MVVDDNSIGYYLLFNIPNFLYTLFFLYTFFRYERGFLSR